MSLVGDSFKNAFGMILTVMFFIVFAILIFIFLMLVIIPRIPWDSIIKKAFGV